MKKFGQTFTGADAPGSSVPKATPTTSVPKTQTPATGVGPTNSQIQKPKFPVMGQAARMGQMTGFVPQNLPGGITPNDITRYGVPGFDKDIGSIGDARNVYDSLKPLTEWNKGLNDSVMGSNFWDSANNIDTWLNKHRGHPLVQKLMADPAIQQKINLYRGPVGQVGRTVAPMLGDFAKDPTRFAQLLNMPGIKELYQNTLGQAGIPGLALAHSYMSGNMGNWNKLTAGLWDPSKRVKQGDAIDRHIARMSHKD